MFYVPTVLQTVLVITDSAAMMVKSLFKSYLASGGLGKMRIGGLIFHCVIRNLKKCIAGLQGILKLSSSDSYCIYVSAVDNYSRSLSGWWVGVDEEQLVVEEEVLVGELMSVIQTANIFIGGHTI